MKRHILRIAVILLVFTAAAPARNNSRQSVPGRDEQVRNIILMIGDGMGLAHVTALMIENEYQPINIERTTSGGFVKTYSANNRVTDSAASGTAYSTGQKTNNSYLGVDTDGNRLETILEKAVRKGMHTGLVVTCGIQHATPAVFYGHDKDRGSYENISVQLLDSGIDVAIGGGRDLFDKRSDGRNLIGELNGKGYFIADNLEGLDNVHKGKAMTLYPGDAGGLPMVVKGRDPLYLAKATAKALEILTNNDKKDKGFFMMVEGSQIDGASHSNDAAAMLGETRDFDNAVGVAIDYADAHPGTLVIVLADHETGGLSIPSGNTDFLRPDSGIEFKWGTRGHSATMIPMYSYGAGACRFSGIMENTEVGRRMQEALGLLN